MRGVVETLLFAAAPVMGAAFYGALFFLIRLLSSRFGRATGNGSSSAGSGAARNGRSQQVAQLRSGRR